MTSNGPPIWLILLVVSWITYVLSWILIQTISRYREYAADRGAAMITGAPEHLMSALQKISSDITRIPQHDLREVQGMNAFFIIPTSVKQATASCSCPTRRSRSGWPRSRRSPARWAAPSRNAWL